MLLTTCMVVAGANALNCYLERDSDRLMKRTARRPLPDGRMQPRMALVFGLFLGAVSVPVLTLAINPLTGQRKPGLTAWRARSSEPTTSPPSNSEQSV